ncbi:hypothetical protein [Bradyrhizobium sp. LHD-71]|uniref:hypothetical protein n=1 Tax=Bradyrhizobium sp. LHD-71 TaxID=3072141 RepID=UPI00280CF15A|nr:hypothetical protein [Bradyrhizobium sp. LHD-71]MDQ8730269.1 hypothetical protein [Bradyrhizobium sp. LHD-71]
MPVSPETATTPTRPTALVLPALLTAAGFALTLHVFYPGIMNYDARYVYLDSLKSFYGDWQSPVMTWLWKTIDPIAPGAASMFLLIATLYWLGIGTLSFTLARRSRVLAAALPLLALTPPLFALVGVIWRDVLMASCWLLAAALVFATDRKEGRIVAQAVALGLITLGVLIRPNALAAAPLLIAYAVWPRQFNWRRTALLFVPAMLGLYALMQLVYYGTLGAARQNPLHSIAVFDLGGITYFSGQNQFPATWSPDETAALQGRCYDPSYWNGYWNGDCKFVMAKLEHEQKIFGTGTLTRAWVEAVAAHPIAYLQHRLAFFRTFLFDSQLAMWTLNIDDPPKTVFADRPAFTALKIIHDRLQPTPLFRIGTWLLVSILLCALAWRRRTTSDGAFVIGVCGSAVVYILSYLPLGVAAEYRYGYWTVLASAAGAMVVLAPDARHERR